MQLSGKRCWIDAPRSDAQPFIYGLPPKYKKLTDIHTVSFDMKANLMNTLLRTILTVFLVAVAVLCAPVYGQDGTLRQRFKDRLAERQGVKQERPEQAAGEIRGSGRHYGSIEHSGLTRKYLLYVPASYRPGQPTPLVVALHGGGGNMDLQADDERYGLISKADAAGFIALFPNGYSRRDSGKLATWNAGRCCAAARDEGIDDAGFLRMLVAHVSGRVDIDRSRIYATGMSNGGMMSYRLACEASDVFAGIAAVAGTDNTLGCVPSRPVPVLHIHAKDDSHVQFGGGAGKDARDRSDFTSVPDTVAKWVGLNQCPARPQRVLDEHGAYCDLFAPCKNGTQVKLCVTDTGGHSWPGAEKTRNGSASQALSATDMMWDFFSSTSRAGNASK